MFLPICKLTGSANFGKVVSMKLTSYSAVQVIKFILFSSLFCKVLGEKTKISNQEFQGTQTRSYLRAVNFSATLISSALFASLEVPSASRWLFLLSHYLGCKQFTKPLVKWHLTWTACLLASTCSLASLLQGHSHLFLAFLHLNAEPKTFSEIRICSLACTEFLLDHACINSPPRLNPFLHRPRRRNIARIIRRIKRQQHV